MTPISCINMIYIMFFVFQGPLVPVDTDIRILEATLVLEVLLDR